MSHDAKNSQSEQNVEEAYEDLLTVLDTQEKKDALAEFIRQLGTEHKVERLNMNVIMSMLAQIDQVISEQMDEILHAPEFAQLEASWRGVEHLVKNTTFERHVVIELLDVAKEELYDDLNNALLGDGYEKESGIYRHIYWQAYDKFQEHPFTAIVTDYQLNNSGQDIGLLNHLSKLSKKAQIPLLANVSAEFFDKKNFEDVINDHYLGDNLKSDAHWNQWREFRDDDNSKYIGLCMPRFLGRSPYSENSALPVKKFNYREKVFHDGAYHNVWSSASFAMAANMVKSFEKYGWGVKVVGMESGGLVEGLPRNEYDEAGQHKVKPPIEVAIGQAKEHELCGLGFMPLAFLERTNKAAFFDAASAMRIKDLEDPMEKATAEIAARMQYTMMVCRIAHYLKYRQLKFIGTTKKASDIQRDLEEWLLSHVAKGVTLTDEQIAQRPLREAKVTVSPIKEKPGFFEIYAEFTPHVQITGMDIKLKLVAMEEDPTQKGK